MAGYSGTPLAKKLGIKPGHRVALLHEPTPPIADLHTTLPGGVTLTRRLGAQHDVIITFCLARVTLTGPWKTLVAALAQDGALWVAWPKKASGVPTDVTEDVVRDVALAGGLVDTKVCAVDATWSGLKLVRRLKDRTR